MYKVLLYKVSGETEEYCSSMLPYAKRYADLCKDGFAYTEILCCENGRESVVESFGERRYAMKAEREGNGR